MIDLAGVAFVLLGMVLGLKDVFLFVRKGCFSAMKAV